MKNTQRMEPYSVEKRKELEAARLAEKKTADPNAVLTTEDRLAINEEMKVLMASELQNEKPSIAPEKYVKGYKKLTPNIRLLSPEEKAQRMDKHMLAAEAYGKVYANFTAYIPGCSDLSRPRGHQSACRVMNDGEREQYVNLFRKTSPSYYDGSDLSKEEIDREIKASKRELNHLLLGVITRVADENEGVLNPNMSDMDLIASYESKGFVYNFIGEMIVLMQESVKDGYFDDFGPEDFNAYYDKINSYMSDTAILEKRMAMMADPYYTEINIETFLDTNPSNAYSFDVGEEMEQTGLIEDSGDVVHENIASIASDIGFSNLLYYDEKIAKSMGMTAFQMKTDTVLYDKDGNIVNGGSPVSALASGTSPVFIVSKYGDMEPVPVMLDMSKEDFALLIGQGAIVDAHKLNAEEPAELSWFQRMMNWLSELTNSGQKTKAMEEYLAAKNRYEAVKEYSSMLKHLAEGDLPQKVSERVKAVNEYNREIEGSREKIQKDMNYSMRAMAALPEEDVKGIDTTAANILIDKAWLSPANDRFRQVVLDVIEPFKHDNPSGMDLSSIASFKEFMHTIRRMNPELLQDLRSADAARSGRAVDVLAEKFLGYFNGKRKDTPVSDEFKATLKEQKAKEDAASEKIASLGLKVTDPSTLDEDYGNARYWDSIGVWYGSNRRLMPNWTPAHGSNIYTVDNWNLMQKTAVDLNEIKPEGMALEENTFRSLGMILSLRPNEWFTGENMQTGKNMPETMPMEDLIVNSGVPRDNSNQIIQPIVEPTRAKMLGYLANMNEIVEGSNPPATGKTLMAKDIADSLKIFSSHAGGFSWTERRHGFMTSTVEKVMEFAQQHGMKDMVLDQLDEETKQKLDAFCAMGRITTEAYDAVTDLVHDADGTKPLTIEEKRRCIDKIVLAKAVQVDVQSSTKDLDLTPPEKKKGESKEEFNKRLDEWTYNIRSGGALSNYEMSAIAKDIPAGGTYLKDLADRMVSEAERNELAKKGSAAICNAFDLQRVGYGNWATHMKNNEAAEARRRLDIRREKDIFKNFEERLAKLQALGADNEFEPLIEAYAKIMESGSEVSKKFLASLSEDNLRLCNQALKDNPKLDLNKALMAHAKAETIQNGQPAVQAAPQR